MDGHAPQAASSRKRPPDAIQHNKQISTTLPPQQDRLENKGNCPTKGRRLFLTLLSCMELKVFSPLTPGTKGTAAQSAPVSRHSLANPLRIGKTILLDAPETPVDRHLAFGGLPIKGRSGQRNHKRRIRSVKNRLWTGNHRLPQQKCQFHPRSLRQRLYS